MDTGQHQPDDHSDDDGEYHAPDPVIHLRSPVRSFGGLIGAFNGFQDSLDTGHDPAGDIARAKPGHDFVTNNLRGTSVGKHAFEPIPHLDTDLSIFDGDEQERAVVGAFLAKLPTRGYAVRKVEERIAFERRHDQNHHLIRGLLFMRFQFRLDLGRDIRGQDMGRIDDAAGQGGSIQRVNDCADREV